MPTSDLKRLCLLCLSPYYSNSLGLEHTPEDHGSHLVLLPQFLQGSDFTKFPQGHLSFPKVRVIQAVLPIEGRCPRVIY